MVALQTPSQLALPLAQYLAMFRAGEMPVAFDLVYATLSELLPMLQGGFVEIDGLRRPANLAVWQRAIEKFVELRTMTGPTEPLRSNAPLLQFVVADVDSAAARASLNRDLVADRQRRSATISQARGDVDLRLITLDQAKQRLREAGINPEVLDE